MSAFIRSETVGAAVNRAANSALRLSRFMLTLAWAVQSSEQMRRERRLHRSRCTIHRTWAIGILFPVGALDKLSWPYTVHTERLTPHIGRGCRCCSNRRLFTTVMELIKTSVLSDFMSTPGLPSTRQHTETGAVHTHGCGSEEACSRSDADVNPMYCCEGPRFTPKIWSHHVYIHTPLHNWTDDSVRENTSRLLSPVRG